MLPKAGRLAFFYSDSMKHEVRPTFRARTAVTLWYYGAQERAAACERADDATGASRASRASDAERSAAADFAKVLCAPNADQPTQTAITQLAHQAQQLPLASQSILAAMAGVPETHFVIALKRLVPNELQALRDRFAKMGV